MFIKFIFTCIITVGLMTPLNVSNADKNFTRLDKLAHYVFVNSTNNDVESYHIASAILSANGDPRTIAAIASVESNFNPKAVGDSGRSIGMFQVQEKLHGPVGSTVYTQARKAVSVLRDMKSIRRYNGKGRASRVYEARVRGARRAINI